MRILTREMIIEAIELVRPSADKILNTKGTTWGPLWVKGRIALQYSRERIEFRFGTIGPWEQKWGAEIDFGIIADAKLEVVLRERMSSRLVVATKPWSLRPGEYLYPGGVTRDDICVAVSGAKGFTDEALAEMVLSTIIMLAMKETGSRMESNNHRI